MCTSSVLEELGEARRVDPLSFGKLIKQKLLQGVQEGVITLRAVWAP